MTDVSALLSETQSLLHKLQGPGASHDLEDGFFFGDAPSHSTYLPLGGAGLRSGLGAPNEPSTQVSQFQAPFKRC